MSGGFQTAGGHVQRPWGQKAVGLQDAAGRTFSTAHGTVPGTGTLRTTPQQKGGGRERCWGRGSASPGGATGSHGGVRAEESGPVCLLCKGLGW